jgi:hypothetical protein
MGDRAELMAALELACRVVKVARALTWHRAISAAGDGEVDAAWARGPAELLVAVLADSPY